MTTPTWTAYAEPSHFFNDAFLEGPKPEIEENDFDDWPNQLNSSVLELQTPVPPSCLTNEREHWFNKFHFDTQSQLHLG